MTIHNSQFEERTDIWTVFVRGTHGEILTLSDMKASSRGSKVYYSLSAKTGIPHTRTYASHERHIDAETMCHTCCIWFGEFHHFPKVNG